MDNAFKYIRDNGGIDTERSYPYQAEDDEECRYNPAYKVATDVGFVDVETGNEEALQYAVATQVRINDQLSILITIDTKGPSSVAIDASHQSFQFYQSGVYREPECSPRLLDHAVLVVG